ncbi:hypothetical protein QL093DRAFT_2363867 [Fusarium oxysporum]|nr:hypothetical protein QL093DRAFT_2363867 [Fusarium oxysporum]
MAVGLAVDFLYNTLISAVLSFMEFFSLGRVLSPFFFNLRLTSTPVMLRNLRHDLWNVVTAAPPSGFFASVASGFLAHSDGNSCL